METTEETTKSIALKELSNVETKPIIKKKNPRNIWFSFCPYSVTRVLTVTWKIFLKQNYNPYILSYGCLATHYL